MISKKILQKLENRGVTTVRISPLMRTASKVKIMMATLQLKGRDYFTAQEIKTDYWNCTPASNPSERQKDYWTAQEVADIIRYIQSNVKDGEDGKDGRDGRDGVDGETPDTREPWLLDAVTPFESFEGMRDHLPPPFVTLK